MVYKIQYCTIHRRSGFTQFQSVGARIRTLGRVLRPIPDDTMKVQRIEPGDWREWKASRLQALADSPEAFASSFAAEKEKPDEAWSEYARHCGASSASAAFLARDEHGRVTGMVAAYVDGGEAANAYICAMWVAPESRNRGVGRLLVDEAAGWLVGTGASEVKAWVSDADSSAVGFYQSLGFAPTGERQPLASRPSIDERLYVLRC